MDHCPSMKNGILISVVYILLSKKGFMMRPEASVCEELLEKTNKYILAKKILAGGTLSSEEVFEYVKGKNTPSVVIGIGSVSEVYHTIAIAKSSLE